VGRACSAASDRSTADRRASVVTDAFEVDQGPFVNIEWFLKDDGSDRFGLETES
jgi:hypothetical protein